MKISRHYLDGVYLVETDHGLRPATKNLVPGEKIYREELLVLEEVGNEEIRTWDPYKSKLAAAILVGMKAIPQLANKKVLYLGAAQGTTCSHVSDIAGDGGLLICVEFAQKPVQKLLTLVSKRQNMVPVLEDARYPERIAPFTTGRVDVLFQDVSQSEQANIFGRNAIFFLKSGGVGVLALKAKSIDPNVAPEKLARESVTLLEDQGLKLLEKASIHEYEKYHQIIIIKKP
ncbi:MAG: fibrillarin-like rRNA/tRNA 2'-O-methyltransferase [Candidatus Hodarchaeales archaeon]|jgi:fibrillarin-like pre-rRNA processing protein